MPNDAKTTFGIRLRQARSMAGLSLRGLSGKINGAVSYNALNKYEKGEMMPSSDVLVAVAKATGQPTGFFFREPKPKLAEVKFRAVTSKFSKTSEGRVRESSQDFFERYTEIEAILGLDSTFKNPLGNIMIESLEDVDDAALLIRKAWNLGFDALPNIHETLENNNVKVYEANHEEGFDGLSAWFGDIPVIALSKQLDKQCLTRKRHTALHELGHLLFKGRIKGITTEKQEEPYVSRFSGAILLPRKNLESELGGYRTTLSIEELKEIKAKYGISMSAIIYRSEQLGLIPDTLKKAFYKLYNSKQHAKNLRQVDTEPGIYEGSESSNRFKTLVFRAVSNGDISVSKASELLKCSVEEFRNSYQAIG